MLILIGAAVSSFILCLASIDAGHDWGDDFALYISQARGIVEGSTQELLEQNTVTTLRSSDVLGPSLYPVGFPLLLAPMYGAFGVDLVRFKVFCTMFFILSLPLMYALFRDRLARSEAAVLIGFVALNPEATRFADRVLSDLPFVFFLFASTLAARRWHLGASPRWTQVALGALLAATYFVRSIGIVLVAALLVQHIVADAAAAVQAPRPYLRSRWARFVPYVVFAGIAMAVWLVYPPADYYAAHRPVFDPRHVVYNARHHLESFGAFFGSPVLFGALLPFVLVGVLRNLRRECLYVALGAGTLAVLLVWPSQQGTRFIFPLFPFVMYFAVLGARDLASAFGRRTLNIGGVALLLVVTAAGIRAATIDYLHTSSDQVTTPAATEMFRFIVASSSESDLIVFFKPRAMRLFTGRNGFTLRRVEDVVASGATFFVTREATVHDRLALVFRNGSFFVYRIASSPPASAK